MSKICCFCGHSKIYSSEKLFKNVKSLIENLILQENVTEFWVGHYGDFDKLSATAVEEIKNKYPYIKLNLILPYLTQEIILNKKLYNRKFDNIIISKTPDNTLKRYKIVECNKYMVKNSDFLICFINHDWSGAALTFKYAKKNNINIFNLAEI